ncbi:MAG: hypothetical protein UH249_01615 [Acutalibacteraceae bacterium]|nr:hypothetical protein [Acutalibacteraceae bacterium]
MAKKKKNAQPSEVAMTQEYDAMGRYGVKSESKKVKKREALIRILTIVLVLMLLFLSLMFACSSYVNKAGDFTVTMDKDAYNMGIILSETKDFKQSSRFLTGEKCVDMLDTTLEWLPDDLDDIDGSHNNTNGQSFLAYTFYVKNAGNVDVDYSAEILIDSVSLGVDEAMRVMVFHNGEPTIYAKPQQGTTDKREENLNDNGESVYDVDKNFVSNTKVMENEVKMFRPGDIDKYTVVVWLEGWDPECVNKILEGEIKMSMKFLCEEAEGSDGSSAKA